MKKSSSKAREQAPLLSDPLFLFKQQSYDFIVEERLPFELAGKGDALYVLFEKQNQTTMGIIQFLCKEFGISRMTLGIAGLKDKDAITRQWISIYKSALDKLGGEKVFINALARMTKVIKADWHTRPLQMTDPIQNHFSIRLRASQKLSQNIREQAIALVEELFTEGFPNFFGTQRFGINAKNWSIGKAIVEKKTSIRDSFEAKFKLQAYASRLFNQYLKERFALGNEPLDGEEIKDGLLMGPVFGDDMHLADPKSVIGKFQQAFIQKHQIDQRFFFAFKQYKIFGFQRALRVYPTETRSRYQGDDLLLEFSLPSGSYASILIHQLLKELERLGNLQK